MSKKTINLNILYYITSGARHQRLFGGKPFYSKYYLKSKKKIFNLELIKDIISEEKIDTSIIDDYRYYNKSKNGFIRMKEEISYPLESDKLILQIHYGKAINPYIAEIEYAYNDMLFKLKELEETKNLNKNSIDLYYLYASPILKDEKQEYFDSINYRLEIKKLVNLFEKSKKEFNCLFECANEKKLRDAIIKQPKILHISSHGLYDKKREYSLFLEEKGILEKVRQDRLKEILTSVSDQLKNINLVFASTCYSETLGKLFFDYGIENVIYIQGKTPISDKAAVKFSENYYSELIKGSTIADAFKKSKELIKSDRERETFQSKKCCCAHWHDQEDCPLKNNKLSLHNNYHIKCDCDYDEYNIHEENCKLIQLIKKDKKEKYFYFEKYLNNKIKICCICCKPNEKDEEATLPPHEESFKFILKQKNPKDNRIIFRSRKEGKLIKNKNCYIMNDKDVFKNFSVVGRREQIKEVYDIIEDEKINNIHFIILHGAYEVGKQNFAESTCIYLFERNVINGYWMLEIKESKEELCEKINQLTHINGNFEGKYIVVIKINYNLEKPIDLLNEILNEKSILNSNLYYIILLLTQNDKIEYSIHSQEKYKVIYLMNLKLDSAKNLLSGLCNSYGYSMNLKNLKENQINELLEIIDYSRKKVTDLAELLGKYNNFEKLKKILKDSNDININANIQSELGLLRGKEIMKLYYFLSIMNYGLPESMLNLYDPNFRAIIRQEDEEHLIYIEPNNKWYTIIDNGYKNYICDFLENEKKEDCIKKCLKIYTKLLFYKIRNTSNEVCFPDSEIHYNFNSYNNKGIWKTFDYEIYESFFLKDNEPIEVEYAYITNNDFDIEKHTVNIYNLIEKNIDIIKKLIFDENNVEQKEYLEQILLMLPSLYVKRKYSELKNIISKSIHLCDKLGKTKEQNLNKSRQRLELFSLSAKNIKENRNININEFNLLGEQGKADAYFLKGFKLKDIESLRNAIDIYEKINDDKIKIQIPYAYYEIGSLYFSDKKYNLARNKLLEGLEITNKYNDGFIKDKILIELALVIEEESHSKEQYEPYLAQVINKSFNVKLIPKAQYLLDKFNQKLEPDIVMLNSNPLVKYDNYSVLLSGIWAEHNNQYYILQKISTNLKRDIRIYSEVLNEANLIKALKGKGKILILQSDDFNEEGEIVLESSNGKGMVFPKKKLEENMPERLKYDVVILCFIKSEKLKNLFTGKVKYLITFDDINLENIEFDMLFKYNELSIDFIIHFIKNSTAENIVKAYEDSLLSFKAGLQKYKKSEIELINKNGKIISLDEIEKDIYKTVVISKKEKYFQNDSNEGEGTIVYVYPMLKIPNIELHNRIYSDEILFLIKKILLERETVINIFSKYDMPSKKEKMNVKTVISFEIMRFLYRHQAFNGKIFYVLNPKKYGTSLKEITDNIFIEKKSKGSKEKTAFVQPFDFAFIVINNFDKIQKIQGNNYDKKNKNQLKGLKFFFEGMPETFQYLIISKSPITKNNSYEIKIKKGDNYENNDDRDPISKKGTKNSKSFKKLSFNNKNSGEDNISSKDNNKSSKISSSPINLRNSEQKERENKVDKESEFTIIEKKSLSDSGDSDSDSSLSESSEESEL